MIKYDELIKIWDNLCKNSSNPVLLYDLYNVVKKLRNKYSELVECNDIFSIRFNQLNNLMKKLSEKYDLIIKCEHERIKRVLRINNISEGGIKYD